MNPLISLVSGTYNRLPLLMSMVQSFRANIPVGVDYEIILVDGGSTDGTLSWCKSQPDIQLIEQGKLIGAIRAFTDGAKLATGKYTLLANDDVTFFADSIMPAVVHLENNLKCGAVAFRDNRVLPGITTKADYHVLKMPADDYGAPVSVIYAQVGLFRTWLGRRIGWWLGVNDEMAGSRTYGGDNFLSAKIWELGYTVDEVAAATVEDHVYVDELRTINGNSHDSDAYYSQWPGLIKGPTLPPVPQVEQEDQRQVRVLYMPIYEPGYPLQKQNKRGLREALQRGVQAGKPFLVWELDYMDTPDLHTRMMDILRIFKPHIFLSQIQSPVPFTAALAKQVRQEFRYLTWINWNGDEGINGLIGGQMLDILKYVDLQLIVNMAAMPIYEERGIRAAYWQVAYEPVNEPLPDMPAHEVVWLANLYNEARRAVAAVVNEFPNAHIYTPGVPPETLYRFDVGRALYRNAKIGIGTNEYPDSPGFVSNRLFEALAAGGCLFLQQYVKDLGKLTGLLAGVHYIEWKTPDDLRQQLRYWLDPAHEAERRKIAEAGQRYVLHFHSFDARLRQLFDLMKGQLGDRQAEETMQLDYIGPRTDAFGAGYGVVSGAHYEYQPGYPLIVDKRDAPFFLRHQETWKVAE